MTQDTIHVHISFSNEPIKLNITENTVVEDVIIEVCKQLKISPVTRPLFALKNTSLSPNAWLSLSHKLWGDKIKINYEFALRCNVPNVHRLMTLDFNTFNFYFKQARNCVLRNKVADLDIDEKEDYIIGLGVCDMCLAMLEEGVPKQTVVRNYRNYLPSHVIKRHKFFVKKPVIQNFYEASVKWKDPLFLKAVYVERFRMVAPKYLVEEFDALLDFHEGRNYSVKLRVNPFDAAMPGISMKVEHKEWEHVCTIDDLCYIDVQTDNSGVVMLSRKNGIPVKVSFHIMTDMTSFVTLLDAYYRLTAKWTFNLCSAFPTPSLERLFKLKCHGPISGAFAYKKLDQHPHNVPGTYILRESDRDYDSYYIDVRTKSSLAPKTKRIERTKDGRYRLDGEEKSYDSINALTNDHNSETEDLWLSFRLPPSEYDESNLLFCRDENCSRLRSQGNDEESSANSPLCINVKSLMMFKTLPSYGHSSGTIVYPGQWNVGNGTKKSVAIKVLLEKKGRLTDLNEFLALTSRWAFVNVSSVVKLYGVTLANPVSMVMEYLPMGQLDIHLGNSVYRPSVKEITLLNVACQLARAVFFLAEQKFVHGFIRCRKLLVVSHTDENIIVKLADPGVRKLYTDFDLHWIPPEYHGRPIVARKSHSADVWAFATTLWEIYSYGACPSERNGAVIKKFYSSPKNHLPRPEACPMSVYSIMMDCWNYDPYSRKTFQEVFRDMNHTLTIAYNTLDVHQYTAIRPNWDPDNLSNNSKTSTDYCTSVLSDMTLRTSLGETDGNGSVDSSLRIANKNHDDYQANMYSDQFYRCIIDRGEMLAMSGQQDNESFSSISSMQSIFELDKEWNLVLKGSLGNGFFGRVFKAELHHHYDDKVEPRIVAVKKLKRDAMTYTNRAELDKEISTLLELDHPNIVKVVGRIQDPELCLVMEYIESGALKSYVAINKIRLSSHHLLKFGRDVARGMTYLFSKHYVHRDLAARNILIAQDNTAKISDFGLARFIGDNNYYVAKSDTHIPIQWHAPESISQLKFSTYSDVWAFGCTFYEMYTFGEDPALPNVEQKAEPIFEALKRGIRLPMPPKCPQYVYTQIMVPCWRYEASQRPDFTEICKTIEDTFSMHYS